MAGTGKLRKRRIQWHIKRQVEVHEMAVIPNRNAWVSSGMQASRSGPAVSSLDKEAARFIREKMLAWVEITRCLLWPVARVKFQARGPKNRKWVTVQAET